MYVIDAHCDVLSKMLLNPKLDFTQPQPSNELEVTLPNIRRSNMLMQWFALWLPPKLEQADIRHVLQAVDMFHTKIAEHPDMQLVQKRHDLAELQGSGKIGALLSLEGADALAGNLGYLRLLYKLGLRALGLTWNYANWAADGVLEPRQGGFTRKGRELVKECDRLGILIDVSHLTEKGFWELAEMTESAFLASHSNAYAVCGDPRNLKDEQIEEIVRRKGMIGLNFYPPFIAQDSNPATMDDLLRHVERILELGGADCLGLGSDFDGIDLKVPGLEDASCFGNWEEQLLKRYSQAQTEKIMFRNWLSYLERVLPTS
ncbi:dipeptidase [Paenibacillus koleovorans]|uniref:dipeptidase n=1 Tax=Paenibacillus koleovorans TaxID=121608 RepID=UPI000FDC92FA|nr:dipeptidase [Paenibacillus koleovorans]